MQPNMVTDQLQLEYANAVKNLKISDPIHVLFLDGVNKKRLKDYFLRKSHLEFD